MPYRNPALEDPRLRRQPLAVPNDLPALPVAKPAAAPVPLPAQAGAAFRRGQQNVADVLQGAVAGVTRPVVEPLLTQAPRMLGQVAGGLQDFARAAVGAPPRPLASPPVAATAVVPAVQAATNAPPPLATRPATFADPAGNARYFADQGAATTAQKTLGSPQGQEKLRTEILNRTFDLEAGKIPEGKFTEKELTFAAPGPAKVLDEAPALAAPPAGVPAATPGTDVIRGTKVSRTGAGEDVAGSPADLYTQGLVRSMQAGQELGADMRQYLPEVAALAKVRGEEPKTKPLSLTQAQAQRYQELVGGAPMTEADRLVFGKGQQEGPRVYTQKITDELGNVTEVPYTLAEGNVGQRIKFQEDEEGPQELARPGEAQPPPRAKLSLSQWLAKARQAPENAGVPDETLTQYYRKVYGGR